MEEEEEGEGEVEVEMGAPPQMDNSKLPVDATTPLSCRERYLDRGTTPAAWGEEDWRWGATLWWRGQTGRAEGYHLSTQKQLALLETGVIGWVLGGMFWAGGI